MRVTVESAAEELHKRRALPVMALLLLVLQLTQTADLVHTHDQDLQSQYDCEICLKLGSAEALTASGLDFSARMEREAFAPSRQTSRQATFLAFQSRAPPLS